MIVEWTTEDRRWKVLCEYIIWKLRNKEEVEQRYFDALDPKVVVQLVKKAAK